MESSCVFNIVIVYVLLIFFFTINIEHSKHFTPILSLPISVLNNNNLPIWLFNFVFMHFRITLWLDQFVTRSQNV